jgi:acetyl-CoA carboxylase carboxyl transferase subunit alpha
MDELQSSEKTGKKEKVAQLEKQIEIEWAKISPHFTPINIVQIARHAKRPYTLDYIEYLTEDFMEIHGDRRAGDDPAIVAGFGFYRGSTV